VSKEHQGHEEDAVHRGADRLSQVPVGAPGEPAVRQLGDLGHRGRAEVARLRQDRGVEVHPQILAAGLPPAGVLEVAGEVGPAIDLEELRRELTQVYTIPAVLVAIQPEFKNYCLGKQGSKTPADLIDDV
jgi:hypothetical protein